MICKKPVVEVQLMIKKFPVGSVQKIPLTCKFSVALPKKNAGKQFHKRLREVVKQLENQFDEQGYISFDPLHDGNCQFSSICRILREFGFQRPTEALRTEIVSYLEANPNDVP